MWYDMFEKTPVDVLRSYGMHELVEPVIWGYAEYLLKENYFDLSAFGRFGDLFKRLWIASAFKGANWPDQPFVDVRRYAQNHLGWLQVMKHYEGKSSIWLFICIPTRESMFLDSLQGVNGVILTGWQRFDHFAMLCELLPPALPSLVFNLQIIKQGGMKPEIFDITRKMLNCELPSNWTVDAPEWKFVESLVNHTNFKFKPPQAPALKTLKCDFPGSDVYALIERLRLVKHEYSKL